MEENDPKSAISFYEEAIKLDSSYFDAHYNKAMAQLKINQLDQAIHSLDDALYHKPDDFEGYFQRGLAYMDNGEFYKSKEDALKLLSIDNQSWKSYFLLGLVEEKLKNYSEALSSFEKAVSLDPNNSDLLVNQATLLYYVKKPELAMTVLEKAELINPSEPNLHNLRSMIYFDKGDYSKSLEAVEKAIALNKGQAYFYNNKGLYLMYLGELEEGLDLINQSLKMDPNNPYALRNKGIYYVLKEDKVTALQFLTELNENYPEMDLVKEYLQKAYAQ